MMQTEQILMAAPTLGIVLTTPGQTFQRPQPLSLSKNAELFTGVAENSHLPFNTT